MNLLTKSAFARWAGKSAPAVTKALKLHRIELFKDTDQINTGSPKSQAFRRKIGKGQKNITTAVTGEAVPDKELEKANKKILVSQKQKAAEESELKKQNRIKAQLVNAKIMGGVVDIESIDTMIMTYFDSWLNTNKRRFNGSVDEFLRMAFQLFENEKGEAEHDISRATFKRKWATRFEEWQYEGNQETMKRLSEIQEGQSKG